MSKIETLKLIILYNYNQIKTTSANEPIWSDLVLVLDSEKQANGNIGSGMYLYFNIKLESSWIV
jgi:hypothetical protein